MAGPAGSSFSADDFKIVTPPGFFSCHPDIHLEVGQDATTGDHTLYVVTHHGLVDQVYSYPGEGTRDKKEEASSSLTNAASWRFELIPDPTNAAAISSLRSATNALAFRSATLESIAAST